MFCRIASFFLFSFYNKFHFLKLGGDLMENKEVRKVITFEAIRDILFSNMPYLNEVLEKITGINMVELDKKSIYFSKDDDLKEQVYNMIIFSISNYPTISETVLNSGSLCCWFYEKNDLVPKNVNRYNFHFGHLDSFCSNEFVSKRERLDDDGRITYDYLINLDYLYECDEEVFSNSNTLEYLLYPFICFDLEKLISIYKDDEKMLKVMATLKVLKENAYTLEYSPIKVSV